MGTKNKLPEIDIAFKYKGVSAISRSSKGVAGLLLKDDTTVTPGDQIIVYKSVEDLTEEEIKKWSTESVQKIKDTLEGTLKTLYVCRMAASYTAPTLTGFSIATTNISVKVGETVQLKAYDPVPTGAIIGAVTYTSSDDTKATVDSSGVITGVEIGATTITVTETKTNTTSTIDITVAATISTPEKQLPTILLQNNKSGLIDVLKKLNGKLPRNCWIGLGYEDNQDTNDLISWVKSKNTNDKRRYKALVYNGINCDDIHIVNLTTKKVTFRDDRGEVSGDKAIPYLLGVYAGLVLNISAIALTLDKFESVTEVDDLNLGISNGELLLMNDEGHVKIASSVNSLITIGEGVGESYTDINVIEKMDLIFTDLFDSIKHNYVGKYGNTSENQTLLLSAINGYLDLIELDNIIDPSFDNKVTIDLIRQKIANYPKFTKEVVDEWNDEKIRSMTVGKEVFLTGEIKIVEIMKDFFAEITTN